MLYRHAIAPSLRAGSRLAASVTSVLPSQRRGPIASYSEVAVSPAPSSPPAPAPPAFPAPLSPSLGFPSLAPVRVYANYHVYKTRAAMAVSLIPPTFAERTGSRTLERDGTMLVEFAAANPAPPGPPGPAGAINRTYNWANKVVFALSAHELGAILAGDGLSPEGKGIVLYHDPTKLGKTGEPMKKLTLKQLPDGAINFNLSAGPDNLSVPVNRGEFEVFRSLAQYAIPRLLGFDAVFSS